MIEKSEEREISLIDLWVDILLRWRSVIVVMLVGGILFGSFSYVQSVKSVHIQKAQAEMSWYDLLTEKQCQDVQVAVAHQKLYESYLDYQRKSVLMNVDGLAVPTVQMVLYVEADSVEESCNIADTYKKLIAGVEASSYLMEQCGISSEITELITIRDYSVLTEVMTSIPSEFNTNVQTEVNVKEFISEKGAVIPIELIYPDEKVCLILADAMLSYVKQKQADLETVVGQHDVILLSRSKGKIFRQDIMEAQKNCVDNLYRLQNICEEQQNEFTDIMKKYFDYMLGFDGTEKADANITDMPNIPFSKPTPSVKYVILGILLCGFAYIFCVFLRYVWNTKLRVTDNVKEMFGITRLAVIPAKRERKKFGGGCGCLDL